jgi:arylsulfatase
MRPPWIIVGKTSDDPAGYPWELFDLRKDWTQSNNIAAENPAKLKEMQEIFWREAKKYQVLPLDSTVATRLVTPRPSITAGRDEFVWTMPLTGTPNGDAPSVLNASYKFKAEITVPQSGAEGMLITQGGRFGGYGFYLLKGKPVFLWNLVDLERLRWEGPEALSPGKHTLEFEFTYDGLGMGTLAYNSLSGIGRNGNGVLKVDGKVVAEQKMERTIPLILQWDESLDVGSDTLTGVDDRDYQPPFAFTGKIDKITLTINRPKLTPADIKKLALATRNNKTSE